jgi:hypothetical protein
MLKRQGLIIVTLLSIAALAMTSVALAQPSEQNVGSLAALAARRATPSPKAYRRLEADFSIYNWRKSDKLWDLTGTMTVYARGGDGHYTYEFIGLHYTSTFDFRWKNCSVLVNSLRVWSGDGQQIDIPVWREDLPCFKHWRDEDGHRIEWPD